MSDRGQPARLEGAGRLALVTGAAGFKGRWLMELVARQGFVAVGWDIRKPTERGAHRWRQLDLTQAFVLPDDVDFVFHLAAQALVPVGYEDPRGTWSANVMSTVNVLEALRSAARPVTAIIVTSDKVYRLPPAARPLDEDDELGGYCPYSTSKAACELVVQSYRTLLPEHVRVATVRAGNVIGGGDESPHRLVPDIIRAARDGRSVELRNPGAIRPWLFVLDCLWGYMQMAHALSTGSDPGPAMNFGPGSEDPLTVGQIAELLCGRLGSPPPILGGGVAFKEAPYLQLETARAHERLGWWPLVSLASAIEWTAEWAEASERDPQEGHRVIAEQIERYLALVG